MPMANYEVLRKFILEGRCRRGSRVFADADDAAVFSFGRHFPLVLKLADGFLVNGERVSISTGRHQEMAIDVLNRAGKRFAVVPFVAIESALNRQHVLSDVLAPRVRQMLRIAVPSSGERWRDVEYRKADGTRGTRSVHTLGDSVLRLAERYWVSAVDPTGTGRGLYFFTQLVVRQRPRSVEHALEALKPPAVRRADRAGAAVSRQGEWFAVPQKTTTRRLMRDVRRGIAVFRRDHVLGRDGHHQLTQAVIYKYGPKKGWVYARGAMRHTRGEHRMLRLPAWSRIVHGIQGSSYSLPPTGRLRFD